MLKNSALILSHAKKISFGSLQYRHQSYFGMRGGNLDNVNQDVDKIAQGYNITYKNSSTLTIFQ